MALLGQALFRWEIKGTVFYSEAVARGGVGVFVGCCGVFLLILVIPAFGIELLRWCQRRNCSPTSDTV